MIVCVFDCLFNLSKWWLILKREIQIKIDVTSVTEESPAAKVQRENSQALQDAKNILSDDPHVQSILQDFGGVLEESSIKLTK